MDTKSLAKSKRAHSQHHKKHHPNQKVKVPTISIGASGTDKAVKEKPRESPGSSALPSNWDRYEDEDDLITENQIDGHCNQPIDVVIPKSKGADYAYLISEAKSQNSTGPSSEIFPSFDDFVSDFGQGKGSFFAVRGESLLSSIQNDSFIVEDKATASYEASFLSLDLRPLSEQLAKIDLPKRLFMEPDFFPPEPYSESEQERHNESRTIKSHHQAVQDHTNRTVTNPTVHPTPNPNPKPVPNPSENKSKFKPETAEAELDTLLDSFIEAKLTDSTPSNTSTIDIDRTLDDLLNETATPARLDHTGASSAHEVKSTHLGFEPPSSQPVPKSKLLDDFDSWFDAI